MTTEHTFAGLVEDYAAIRELIDAEEAKIKPLKEIRDKIGQALLAELNKLEMSSAKAKNGARVDTVKALSVKVEDREAWLSFVFENGDDSFLTNHVSKEAVDAYISEHNEPPPGVRTEQTVTLRFTKAKG